MLKSFQKTNCNYNYFKNIAFLLILRQRVFLGLYFLFGMTLNKNRIKTLINLYQKIEQDFQKKL